MSERIRRECSSVGSDESGTGGLFGGCAFASFRLTKETLERLTHYPWFNFVSEVRDSKRLTDEMNIALFEEITRDFMENENFSIMLLDPKKYNSLLGRYPDIKMLKRFCHNQVHFTLTNEFTFHTVDNFLGTETKKYEDDLMSEGEYVPIDKYCKFGEMQILSISIASILARGAYLKHFRSTAKELGIALSDTDNHNKPSTRIEVILDDLERRGKPRRFIYENFCKRDQVKRYLRELRRLKGGRRPH